MEKLKKYQDINDWVQTVVLPVFNVNAITDGEYKILSKGVGKDGHVSE